MGTEQIFFFFKANSSYLTSCHSCPETQEQNRDETVHRFTVYFNPIPPTFLEPSVSLLLASSFLLSALQV